MHMTKILVPLAGCMLLASCGDSGTGPRGSADARVTFRAARVGNVSAAQIPGAMAGPNLTVNVSDGTNALVIQTVSLTLQDIDMERTAQSVDCKDGANAGNRDCSDWVDGPIRVNLNLNDANRGHELTIPLQAGTYDVISFDITVPDGGDPAEVAYIAAHPDMAGASVLVTGTFNGQAFTYKTFLTGDREVTLVPPLVVTEDASRTFTFAVEFDVAMWFRRSNGSLIDPRTTSSSDRETIRANIRDRIESESIP